MSFGMLYLLVAVTLMSVWMLLNYRSSFRVTSDMDDTVAHFEEFAFLYHLVNHPRTYVLWQVDVKEGCVEAYKYSAVKIVGL